MSRPRTAARVSALRRAGQSAARSSGETNRSGPLRRVIRQVDEPHPEFPRLLVRRLVLECGHHVPLPRGPFGEDGIAGERRRCAPCGVAR